MPRMGMGMPLVATAQSSAINVQDFFWLNDISSELTPIHTASRTNFLTYSEDFSQSVWTKQSGITPTYNTTETLSPVGTNNATKFIGNGSSGVLKASLNVSGVVTRSVHLKSVTGTVNVILKDPNKTITSKSLTVTTEWQRFDLTEDNTTSLQGIWIDDIPVSGVYMWGAQVEQDSRVNAYIPTSGSAVTVATTLNDTHDTWDFDSTDLMLEADPDSEGAWERPSNIVLNHDYADLGSELVANTNFTNGTANWSAHYSTNTTLNNTGGVLNVVDVDAGGARAATPITTIVGKTYQFVADVLQIQSALTLLAVSNAANLDGAFVNGSNITTPTNNVTIFFTATATTTHIGFKRGGSIVEGQTNTYDNVSVKQIDPNDRWTLGTGWSIEDGKAVAVAPNSSGFNLSQSNILTSGETYEITFTVSERTAGSVRFRANTVNGTTRSTNGTFTEIITVAGTTFILQALNSFVGKVDNVTVKEYAITPLDV